MSNHVKFAKVNLLIDQERYDSAQQILADILRENPNSVRAIVTLSEIKLQLDRYDEANALVDRAIGLLPNDDSLFFFKSRILLCQRNYSEATKYIEQAIRIEANDAAYYAMYAAIKLQQKDFKNALFYADKALELDAENVEALNMRSMALTKLNRKKEAYETIEGALRHNPNDDSTHSNYGWGLLEHGENKKALEHFKEALTKNPGNSYAQAGMLEALKAANPVYRLFLKYVFFMNKLTEKYQWGVIIGFYVLYQFLSSVAETNSTLGLILTPVLILMFLFAFSTWIAEPISNLFLRFNKYGQYLLTDQQKMSSNLVAVSLGVAVIGLILFFFTLDERMLSFIFFGIAMMIPLSTVFRPSKPKNALRIYSIGLGLVGALGIAATFATGNLYNLLTIIFGLGFFAYQWVANYMIIRGGH